MEFRIKRRTWDASAELRPILSEIQIPEASKADFEAELWNDLCSEFDSIYFYRHAKRFAGGYSAEFTEFLEAWKADEANHARGFLKLYQEAFREKESSVLSRLAERPASFERLSAYFEDEFKICLLIAYDELATTHAYHLDRSFYAGIGGKPLEQWISKIKSDEAIHFANLISVIRARHLDRVSEARAVLEGILKLDLEQERYNGTFVLDHTGAPFTSELLAECVNRIVKKLEALQ